MIEINLHPSRDEKKRRKKGLPFELPKFEGFRGLGSLRSDPWNVAFIAALVLVPLLVGGLWLLQRAEAGELEARLHEAVADSVELAEMRVLTDSLTERQELIRTRIRRVEQLDRHRFVWPRLLDEISGALPGGVWLTFLEREAPLPEARARIQGMALTPLLVTDFVRNLQDSPSVGEVQIVSSQLERVERIRAQAFVLVVYYSEPPPEAVVRVPLVPEGS